MRILQVNTYDVWGGAERIATSLQDVYRRRGHEAWLAVGRKRSARPDALLISNRAVANPWASIWWGVHERLQPWYRRSRGARGLCRLSHVLASPLGWLDDLRGRENFRFPGTGQLVTVPPAVPDIVHGHNLHGRYFDLTALPLLSMSLPVVLTLHDAWLLSGHCAHSFGCERWLTGCGNCPDLTIYPAIRRDASAVNWARKREIFSRCRLHVATPCHWLMDQVERSILAPAIVSRRVIRNGVDLSIFKPWGAEAARAALNLPLSALILLSAGYGVKKNDWKDYATMHEALQRTAAQLPGRRIVFLALGEAGQSEQVGTAEVRFLPFVEDPTLVARYYQAADVYVHAARADTFPTSILEALACGTPVAATATGGIPEQVRSLAVEDMAFAGPLHDEPTGILSPQGDAAVLAQGLVRLLTDDELRQRMGAAAARDARTRFDLERQADAYLLWYEALLDGTRGPAT
jgi:glycosyltransferase involved in cell wall biosynthesis